MPFRRPSLPESQPSRVANHDVEQIAVKDEVSFASGADVDGTLHDLNPAEVRSKIVAEKLVMIARDVDQPDAFAPCGGALDDVVMLLRPGQLDLSRQPSTMSPTR